MTAENVFRQEQAVFSIEGINSAWEKVAHRGTRLTLPRHHEFETHNAADFFLLLQGSVKLSCLSENGLERVVMRVGPGSIFHEVPHIHQSLLQTFSIRTLEECTVLRFPKSLLTDQDFLCQHPELTANLIHSLGIKVGAFFAQLFDSGLLEISTRVSRSLYHLWQENGEIHSFCPGLTQSDLAITLGVHRSSLCRVIKALREKNIIGKFTKRQLEIFEPEALAHFSENTVTIPPSSPRCKK